MIHVRAQDLRPGDMCMWMMSSSPWSLVVAVRSDASDVYRVWVTLYNPRFMLYDVSFMNDTKMECVIRVRSHV